MGSKFLEGGLTTKMKNIITKKKLDPGGPGPPPESVPVTKSVCNTQS